MAVCQAAAVMRRVEEIPLDTDLIVQENICSKESQASWGGNVDISAQSEGRKHKEHIGTEVTDTGDLWLQTHPFF